MKVFPPGTRVTMVDGYGPYHGRVVVCLCKRHVWQKERQGRECGHADCGYPAAPEACPWPMHVLWDDNGESHQGMDGLTVDRGGVVWEDNGPAHLRPVPVSSGEAAIYSPECLTRTQEAPSGTDPGGRWHTFVPCT